VLGQARHPVATRVAGRFVYSTTLWTQRFVCQFVREQPLFHALGCDDLPVALLENDAAIGLTETIDLFRRAATWVQGQQAEHQQRLW
jgi:hypothetical protein